MRENRVNPCLEWLDKAFVFIDALVFISEVVGGFLAPPDEAHVEEEEKEEEVEDGPEPSPTTVLYS